MKQSLLIADGDAGLCDAYQRFFTNVGYGVETAGDGVKCLETAPGDASSAGARPGARLG
jgi:hypothetical protein